MRFIDDFLNSITMYRVVLYGLTALTLAALLFSLLGILALPLGGMLISLFLILVVCYLSNTILAKSFSVSANVESVWITGLILFLIVAPIRVSADVLPVVLVAVVAMASKYVLAWQKRHLFNPAALALVVMGLVGSDLASWWVGNLVMLPLVLLVGLLIVRKIRRFRMFLAFMVASSIMLALVSLRSGVGVSGTWYQTLISWPIIFFGTVMLTEPLTMPGGYLIQVLYGALVGVIFASQIHLGSVYSTPEIALVVGNIFAYVFSNKQKLLLTLQAKRDFGNQMYDFSFSGDKRISFQPGQYGEWTLGHHDADSRGIRRYFTIASSPGENLIHLGIKTFPQGSSFKQALQEMKIGDHLMLGQIGGDFILPEVATTKLVLIAGGIGITPFRSQIQDLIDRGEKRDLILLYACAKAEDFVYTELFKLAETQLNLQVHYIVTNAKHVDSSWTGKTGYLNQAMVQELVPDYRERTFYISGPGAMVKAYKHLLGSMAVSGVRIKTDYFPGF